MAKKIHCPHTGIICLSMKFMSNFSDKVCEGCQQEKGKDMKLNNVLLKELIQDTGKSFVTFAKQADIPLTTLTNVLQRTVKNPSFIHVVLIMRALDIDDYEELVIENDDGD